MPSSWEIFVYSDDTSMDAIALICNLLGFKLLNLVYEFSCVFYI